MTDMTPPANESFNPYRSPPSGDNTPTVVLPESEAELSLPAKFDSKDYLLRGDVDRLQILDDQGKAFDLPRRPLFAKLVHGTLIRNSLRVKLDKTCVLQLSKEDFATLKAWIGRPSYADLCEAVAANSWWSLPLAAISIVPALSQEFLVSKILSMTIGVLLIAQFVFARVKPHRTIFLLSALIFALMAVQNGHRCYSIFADESRVAWVHLPIILLLGNFCLWWIRQFIAYGEMDPNTQSRNRAGVATRLANLCSE